MNTNNRVILGGALIGAITGLMANETISGIDFRPSDNTADNVNKVGLLYGVSNQSRLYVIDPETGVATVPTQMSVMMKPESSARGSSRATIGEPILAKSSTLPTRPPA